MHRLPKRALFGLVAPAALAAVIGGSIAFAQQSDGGTPTGANQTVDQQTPDPTAPTTTPGTPANPGKGSGTHDSSNCPNMGGGQQSGSGPSTGTSFHGYSRSSAGV